MTKEQEEAIDYVQKQIDYFKEQIKFIEAVDSDYYDEEYELYKNRVKQFETVLSMLKQKDKEIEKQDKIIDLMLKAMNKIQDPQVCKYCDNKINLNHGYCVDAGKCKEGIKQYFEQKATKNS